MNKTAIINFIKGHIKVSTAILFLLTGLLIYSNAVIDGIFIFDDSEYILGNPIIQSLSYFNLSDPRQIGYLSFALNYALGGEDPVWYHLVNVLIHITNAVIVFLFVRLILNIVCPEKNDTDRRHDKAAFLAGIIFLAHPIQTQAVSYAAQRFTCMSTLFYVLSVYLYLLARERLEKNQHDNSAYAGYGISLLSTALAMRTKEIAFTIPFMIAFFDFILFKISAYPARRFFLLAPSAATLVIIPLSIFGPEWGLINPGEGVAEITRKDKIYDLYERSPFEYLFTQFRVIVTYIRLLFLPVNQIVVYDFKPALSFFNFRVMLSLLLLLSIAGFALYMWRKADSKSPGQSAEYKLVSLGILWFFIALSVESSFIPIKDIIFEHRIYLPSIGFIAAASVLIMSLARKFLPEPFSTAKFTVIVMVIVIPLSIGTFLRNRVWTNEVMFWDDVVKKSPDKAMGYNNRGNAYGKIGRYDLALPDIEKTISYFPTDPNAKLTWEQADFTPNNMAKTFMNRGQIYYSLGDAVRGQADFDRAKQILMGITLNIEEILKKGDMFTKHKDYRSALEEYNKILAVFPDNVSALNDRGNAYSQSGSYKEAIADFNRTIELNPDFAMAYHNRGIAYIWLGEKTKALEDFRRACARGFQPACASIKIVESGGHKKEEVNGKNIDN
ncbi:MAG: tetratricopeptide repeat protein [Nitrospirae bacterium]|nr:tetratricopeptide repeat protein [Nitrospirota bacterium]